MPGRTARFSSDLRLLVEKECMIIELQPLYKSRRLHVYQQGKLIEKNDPVVIETQLHLIVNDEPAAELVCSPQAFAELAVGYLLSENLLKDYPDLCSWRLDAQQQAIHLYTKHSWLGQAQHTRQINSYAGRGLGLQTETTGIAAVTSAKDLFTPAQIFAMIDALENSGGTFHLTGGTHNAGLGYQGQLLVNFEDIGRHNAVDKVFGHAFLQQIPLNDKCLVLSGRIASEILLKAARRNIALVVSRSAATGLAIDLAEALGITLVGFTRGDRFNIYCHRERIQM
ncbi:MAG TPA: formate dehydrogenase accessory sulfurtransferase FdhD [Syntrophomonas sp.]|jgi:FdhD protein|nr:formate dehydrogenase accessory sulfurtransferase FdhD [Syntrophomonas sp.]